MVIADPPPAAPAADRLPCGPDHAVHAAAHGTSGPGRCATIEATGGPSARGGRAPSPRTEGRANQWNNSWGLFFETYESYLLPLLDGRVMPGSSLTLAQARAHLEQRRADLFDATLGPVYPPTWSRTFTRTRDGHGPQTVDYVNGRNHAARGTVAIRARGGR